MGNVVGSNIFNILLILGTSATITPIALEVTAVYDTLILIAASLLNLLNGIQDRNAQWYYYSALACSGIGSNVLALQHAREALLSRA